MLISRVLFVLVIGLSASLAQAAAQRTFVATHGSDANACSLTQPCRGFIRALTQTVDGGEIVVLDSGGYGPVTITKSVSVVNGAGINAPTMAGTE